jgi:hypothetical protein
VAQAASGPPEPDEQRLAYFLESGGWILTNVYDAARLPAGAQVLGPAIVQSKATTLLLSPSDGAEVRADGAYTIHVGRDAGTQASPMGHASGRRALTAGAQPSAPRRAGRDGAPGAGH